MTKKKLFSKFYIRSDIHILVLMILFTTITINNNQFPPQKKSTPIFLSSIFFQPQKKKSHQSWNDNLRWLLCTGIPPAAT